MNSDSREGRGFFHEYDLFKLLLLLSLFMNIILSKRSPAVRAASREARPWGHQPWVAGRQLVRRGGGDHKCSFLTLFVGLHNTSIFCTRTRLPHPCKMHVPIPRTDHDLCISWF